MNVCHICHLELNHTNVVSPLLDPALTVSRLLLLVHKEQINDAQLMKSLLSVRGIHVEYIEINTSVSSNTLVDFYIEILAEQLDKKPGEQIIYNATCGQRRNTLLAFDVARNLDIYSYIIEPCLDALHWIHPIEKPDSQLADKLKIKDYFWMHKMTLGEVQNTRGVIPKIREMAAKWLSDLTFFGNAISKLNYFAYQANNPDLVSEKLTTHQLENQALRTLIDDLEDIIKVALKNNRLHFPNEQARFFVNGGWLEEYTFSVMVTLKKK